MRAKAILLFVAAVVFALGPFLVPGFGGFDPMLYPDPQVDPPVQPAGYAFAIWGPIYLWIVAATGFGLIRRPDNRDWDRHRAALLVSLVIGAIWLPVAMVSPIWATILIFAMLVSAVIALARAPLADRWLGKAPIAFYAGWLTAASFASLGLTGAGFEIAFGEVVWAQICIVLAFVAALLIHWMRRDEPVYFLSVIWALIAIAVKNGAAIPSVTWLAAGGAGILAVVMIAEILRTPPGRAPSS
ncbi:hypothetical protein [Maritimibacter sp. HL-12]|uniref:hypothetical protein n=1 Tax=Maritimibacter sp. HL-12 TaxID=1162418 RepID=UPI000A0F1A8E|nr:hypothetical protein [Maritimibacter sp. HL-12]SMH37895.1 hypothetical protein SAMN05661107_0845 [Maritimibacter sp. HL-12]